MRSYRQRWRFESAVDKIRSARNDKGTSRNLLRDAIAALRGGRNPHVPACTLRFLCSVRLELGPLATVSRDSLRLRQQFAQLYDAIAQGVDFGLGVEKCQRGAAGGADPEPCHQDRTSVV